MSSIIFLSLYCVGVTKYYILVLVVSSMVNSKSLGSDLDLVKEFEELKIKQRLLLENLKHQNREEKKDLFLKEIGANVDFLVTVFKETEKNDAEEPQVIEKSIRALSEQITELGKTLSKRMDALEKQFVQKESLESKNLYDDDFSLGEKSEEGESSDKDKKEGSDDLLRGVEGSYSRVETRPMTIESINDEPVSSLSGNSSASGEKLAPAPDFTNFAAPK